MYPKAIGFFDSGQGGLFVLKKFLEEFKDLNFIYLGDNARYPYGNKGLETIQQYAKEGVEFLISQGAAEIIIACGTVSSGAMEYLSQKFSNPCVGIVDVMCYRGKEILNKYPGTVGVLGTRFTTESQSFRKKIKSLGVNQIWEKACSLWVPLVEEGLRGTHFVQEACHIYLEDCPNDVSCIFLGCTHFPYLIPDIAQYLFEKTQRMIVLDDPNDTYEKDIQNKNIIINGSYPPIFLIESGSLLKNTMRKYINSDYQKSHQKIFCTEDAHKFQKIAKIWLSNGGNLPIYQAKI
jgi:glutamate racemase